MYLCAWREFLLSTYTKAGYIFTLPLYTFCFEMTVSTGAKIFAAVLATIIITQLAVVIFLLATQWGHDRETGM